MVKIEDECCGCATQGGSYPCIGDSCPNKHVTHMICDDCGNEVDDLYEYDNDEICEDCLLKRFTKVSI